MGNRDENQYPEKLVTNTVEPTEPAPEPKRCEKHGTILEPYWTGYFADYPKLLEKCGGIRWAFAPCPDCLHEKEMEKIKKQRCERVEKFISPFGSKFQDATFKGYQTQGREQSEAKDAILNFVDDAIRGNVIEKHILLIVGGYGTGKTHLAAASHRRAWMQSVNVKSFEGNQLLRRMKKTYSLDSEEELDNLIQWICRLRLVVFDDFRAKELGEQSATDKELIFELFNGFYKYKTSVIITTNLSEPDFLETIAGPAADRFRECGQVVYMDWDSYRTNREIKEGKS